MKVARRNAVRCVVALFYVAALLGPSAAVAQDAPPGAAQDQPPPLTTEQLQQLVAPIALYPDSLVAQILMASTYPLEVVEAARWVKSNSKVTGKALEDAMLQQTWDPSVKSLTSFPQVLAMMDEKLDWTTDLGNAFLAQQADVMNAVQALRAKAQAAGNLRTTEQQTVTVEQQPAGAQPQTIIIQPANPQVVYVPAYNPATVYGPWPYPAYPPYPYYPPGYAVVGSMISFGVGLAVGSALWGGCNWGGGNVNVNVNRYNNYNHTNINNNNWNHNSVNRRGVPYNNQNLNNRYGNRTTQANAQSRDQFRGRAEQGRQQINRGDANQFKGQQANRGGAQTLGKGAPNRSANTLGQGQANRGANTLGAGSGPKQGNRDFNQRSAGNAGTRQAAGREPAAFGGVGNGGQVRQEANRGRASQQRAASYGGGSRGGGGGAPRGGGGGAPRGGGGGGGARGGGGGRGGGGRR